MRAGDDIDEANVAPIDRLIDKGLVVLPPVRRSTTRQAQTLFDEDKLAAAKGGKRENVTCALCNQAFTVSVGAQSGGIREEWGCARCARREVPYGS